MQQPQPSSPGQHPLDRVSPYLLLILTTLFWAGNFNIARAFHEDIPPLGLSFWRWFMAFLILLPFVLKPMWQQRQHLLDHRWLVLALSALGVASFNSFVYVGLQTTTVTNAAMLQSVTPLFIIPLAGWILAETTSRWQWAGVILSLLGVLLIISKGNRGILQTLAFEPGDLFVLCAVLSWALYTVLLRKLPAALKGLPILGYTVGIGALMILPFYAAESTVGLPMKLDLISVGTVLYVAIFPSVLSYLFWNHATARLGANRAGQFSHLVPVFGVLIAIGVMGERMQFYHVAGIALVVGGLLIANFSKSS